MQLLDAGTGIQRALCTTLCVLAVSLVTGCQPETDSPKEQTKTPSAARPVRVIVVDDSPFAQSLERQWSARTQNKLELIPMTVQQLEEARQLNADIVIYPSECLGTLAHGKLIAAATETARGQASRDQADVFPLQRNAEVFWGTQPYAYSFGSPQLVLMYRADVFARGALQPPGTWPEYQSLLAKLQRSELGDLAPPDDQLWTPVCEPLAPGWAGKTLLARAASYASHPSQFSVLFDYKTMKPLIDGPPFVRALEELVTANREGPADAEQITPQAARQRLFAGHTAIALGWPTRASAPDEAIEMAADIEIAFAELPGAMEAFNFGEQQWTPHEGETPVRVPLIAVAGKLGSVAHNARRPRDASEILALLTGREWSARLSPTSAHTTLFRHSQTATPELWTDSVLTQEASKNYAEVVSAAQCRPIHVSSLRMPGWQRYLAALDQAVYAARGGAKSPQDALAETAQVWAAITAELGVESQREAYTRSLGLEP